MDKRQKITILGATGSIGQSALDVIARHPERFIVHALSGNQQLEKLVDLTIQHQPKRVTVMTEDDRQSFLRLLTHQAASSQKNKPEVLIGQTGLKEIASDNEVDTVIAAIVGSAGLASTYSAVCAGKRVLLANKEVLVMLGEVFMSAVEHHQAELLPIDSEHNAVFQSWPVQYRNRRDVNLTQAGIQRIILTASGGPFRCFGLEQLEMVTPEEACAHPNWEMGKKISIDSATMMNKGLEVIEAHWLFNVPAQCIEVLIHPQSIIHSLVEYVDGSVLAQLGQPDMRTPIAHVLAYPDRVNSGVTSLDLAKIGQLTFEEPDMKRFPCLKIVYDALSMGGSAPAILNAANEVAVASFLSKKITFLQINQVIEEVMNAVPVSRTDSLDQVLEVDLKTRETANQYVNMIGQMG